MKDWKKHAACFEDHALRLYPPCTQEAIAHLEQGLTTPIPAPLREYLEYSNGFGMIDLLVLGNDDILDQTQWHRERMLRQRDEYGDTLEPAPRTPESEIVVSRDSSGDTYVVLQEGSVAKFDHETGKVTWIVASTFDHFLWFLLDDYRRKVRPDGNTKAGYYRSRRWPYTDLPWMLRQDPGLSQYRSE